MNKRLLKSIMAAGVGIIITAACGFADLKIGDTAPQFLLKDLKGNPFTLEKHKGKNIILLNFFATWCENCQEEMAVLRELHRKYKDMGLEVISVDIQERPEKVLKFIDKFQIPHLVLNDPDASVSKAYGLVGFPYNFLIDGDGKIRYKDSRPPADFEKTFNELKATLKPVAAAMPIQKRKGK